MEHPKTKPRAPFRKKDGPNFVDVHVGQRLRLCRNKNGLTQEELAQASGLTFQQIQKYEQGKNRVSASRLHQFSDILAVPVNYFFDQLQQGAGKVAQNLAEDQAPFSHYEEAHSERETAELIRAYYAIKDPAMRKNIMKIIKQTASVSHTGKGKA